MNFNPEIESLRQRVNVYFRNIDDYPLIDFGFNQFGVIIKSPLLDQLAKVNRDCERIGLTTLYESGTELHLDLFQALNLYIESKRDFFNQVIDNMMQINEETRIYLVENIRKMYADDLANKVIY